MLYFLKFFSIKLKFSENLNFIVWKKCTQFQQYLGGPFENLSWNNPEPENPTSRMGSRTYK